MKKIILSCLLSLALLTSVIKAEVIWFESSTAAILPYGYLFAPSYCNGSCYGAMPYENEVCANVVLENGNPVAELSQCYGIPPQGMTNVCGASQCRVVGQYNGNTPYYICRCMIFATGTSN